MQGVKNIRRITVVEKYLLALTLLANLWAPALAVESVDGLSAANSVSASQHLYEVEVERGQRRTASGTKRSYTLYLPKPTADLPKPPYALLVMAHGFFMSGNQQSNNAEYFAQRGFVVLSPNLTRVLWGDKNRLHNIKDVLDQINWVIRQSKNKKSPLYGLIDPERVGMAGNSSGGAVSLELVIQAQKAKVPIHAMCSMDGAPWDRSFSYMPKLTPLKILSLRAEPSICNEHARILNFFRSMSFPFDDIKIIGARHCDAENPTTIGCMCICGRSRSEYRAIFQLFTYLFFRDTFNVARLADPTKSLVEVANQLQTDGKVTVNLNQHGNAREGD
jgi:hypothetical protein